MLKVDGLTKHYGSLAAVDGISFSVESGEVLGFLGPNGAGKTTTMRMIAGFVTPSAGTAEVCGFDVQSAPLEAKARLGYLPEGAPGYGEMTPRQFLNFIADIRGIGANTATRLDEVVGTLHLESVIDRPIDLLSKGFRRRVGLAQALIHEPEVLILDEPTDGLDPNQKYEVRQLINNMAKDKLIVISTHILEEVDAVCTRAIIIAQGKVLADDTPAGLEARSRYHNAVSLKLKDGSDLDGARRAIESLPEVDSVELDINIRRMTAFPRNGSTVLPAVSELSAEQEWEVQELHLESGRLDEVFRDITGGAGT